jgi:DNA-binding NarL/FixJ family response regulator
MMKIHSDDFCIKSALNTMFPYMPDDVCLIDIDRIETMAQIQNCILMKTCKNDRVVGLSRNGVMSQVIKGYSRFIPVLNISDDVFTWRTRLNDLMNTPEGGRETWLAMIENVLSLNSFTQKERRIIFNINSCSDMSHIAKKNGMDIKTAYSHRSAIQKKLNLRTSCELHTFFLKLQ